MTARAQIAGVDKVTIVSVVAKSNAAIVEGVGVKWDTGEADVAGAGDDAFGVALESMTGDGKKTVQVALLNGAGVVKVKCSGTATAGSYAEAGSDGFQNRTLGGGTTVRYIAGKFMESGVDNDFVGLAVGQFAGVSG